MSWLWLDYDPTSLSHDGRTQAEGHEKEGRNGGSERDCSMRSELWEQERGGGIFGTH